LRYGDYPDDICDALEENIGRYIADFEVYGGIDLDELNSIIFDTIVDVCKYYMRTDENIKCQYIKFFDKKNNK
jgi:hypothetical protein